jgi:proline dehydrogenase
MFGNLYRRAVLGVSDAGPVKRFIKRQGWKLGVGRFVAGETLDGALTALTRLEAKGMTGILDLLGEFVESEAGAEAMTREILATLDRLESLPVTRYMSVKPTQLGLGLGLELAQDNARRILSRAREVNAQVCLDMENAPYVDGTLQLFSSLYREGFHNVSTVLQSYMRRSPDDLRFLLSHEPRPAVRIVKGAYRESAEVAYQDKPTVDAKYLELVQMGLSGGAKVGVATHDERLIRETLGFAQGMGAADYEFQLLYGVKPHLQERLVAQGHTVRIYIPYGEDWYGYFSRRLAERPANAMFVLRGLFG